MEITAECIYVTYVHLCTQCTFSSLWTPVFVTAILVTKIWNKALIIQAKQKEYFLERRSSLHNIELSISKLLTEMKTSPLYKYRKTVSLLKGQTQEIVSAIYYDETIDYIFTCRVLNEMIK